MSTVTDNPLAQLGAPVTVDDAIGASLAGIRERFAGVDVNDPKGDCVTQWSAGILEGGKAVVVAIVDDDDVQIAIMQADHDGLLEARTTRGLTHVDFGTRRFLHDELMRRISWLNQEECGEQLE